MYEHFQKSKQAVHQYLGRQIGRHLYDRELIDQSHMIRARHHQMGAKQIYRMLQPKHMGRDRFERLLMENGFRVRRVKNYLKTTDGTGWIHYTNLIAGITLTDVNQVWTSDITYLISQDATVYYVITVMDLYSRRIIGHAASLTMEAEQTSMKALLMALKNRSHGRYDQLIHHSDRGSQYRYHKYLELLKEYNIKTSMCDDVYDNAHQERLNGIIKNNYLLFLDTSGLKQVQSSLSETVKRYNEEKPHSAIQYMTPVDYEIYLQQLPVKKHTVMHIYQQQSTVNSQKKKEAKKKMLNNNNSNNK